jgi:hypothetical protein
VITNAPESVTNLAQTPSGTLRLSSPRLAMGVVGVPHNPIEAALRRSASSSAWRARRDRVVNKVCVSPGTSLSNTEK